MTKAKDTSLIQPPQGRKLLFDTNIYIDAVQVGPAAETYQLLLSTVPRTYLSAVVVQELYAGTLDAFGERLVDKLVRQTEKTGRIVNPTYEEWKEAGRILARIGRREPAQRTRIARLVNDVLLAMSTFQIGATLLTLDREDFRLIRRYKRFSVEIL